MEEILTSGYRSSHFAPAFFFLSSERRHALKILYAVCRRLDDAVDTPRPDASAYLAAWKQAFDNSSPAPVDVFGEAGLAREFFEVVERYELPKAAMTDLIEKGVAVDLAPRRFHTAMETEEYCYGVAGTVGLMCLPIFGVPWQEARDFAVRLGVAVQWVNILRDIGQDAKDGRFYLPLEHLEKFGYTENSFFAAKTATEREPFMRFEAAVARSHFSRAWDLMPPSRRKGLLPARIMGRIYSALLDKIEKKSFPVLSHKVKLNPLELIRATWREIYG